MRRRLMLSPVFLLAFVMTWQATTPAAQGNDSKDAKIWNGVYTAAQAERAKTSFTAVCRRCHNDDLGGSERGPSLRGNRFMSTWETQDLNVLFAKIRDTMPPDSPSSLPDEDYIDLVALILQANSFPAGAENLSAEKLGGILIMRKAGEGPREVPNFRLVEVVGCLAQGPDDAWMLTRTSEPVLTNDQPSSAGTLKEAAAQPLGSQTFRLVSVGPFNPGAHMGQKMQAKGLLYRAPSKDRINLISLEMVSPSCGS
jgi:hypothetical protein